MTKEQNIFHRSNSKRRMQKQKISPDQQEMPINHVTKEQIILDRSNGKKHTQKQK